MIRLDKLLVNLKIAHSRSNAQNLITEHGILLQNGFVEYNPAAKYDSGEFVGLARIRNPKFNHHLSISPGDISRGHSKANFIFQNIPQIREHSYFADIGCGYGGFSKSLLDNAPCLKKLCSFDPEAEEIYPLLQDDDRVIIPSQISFQELLDCWNPNMPKPSAVVTDISFASTSNMISLLAQLFPLDSKGQILINLIKPSFEIDSNALAKDFFIGQGLFSNFLQVSQLFENSEKLEKSESVLPGLLPIVSNRINQLIQNSSDDVSNPFSRWTAGIVAVLTQLVSNKFQPFLLFPIPSHTLYEDISSKKKNLEFVVVSRKE